jgi:hypothetical protein
VVVYGERENEEHGEGLRREVRRRYEESKRLHVPDWVWD